MIGCILPCLGARGFLFGAPVDGFLLIGFWRLSAVQTLIRRDPSAEFFFGGVTRFVHEHAFFGALTAATFLSTDLFNAGAFGGEALLSHRLDLVEEEFASEETVETLLAGVLAFNLDAGWAMEKHDARGHLVDVLAAMTSGADEGFLDIRVAHA